jgi:hypothetical protein
VKTRQCDESCVEQPEKCTHRIADNPTNPAFEWIATYLDTIGSKRTGKASRVWQCPAHGDAAPSLSVNPTRKGEVFLRCFAGCDRAQILAALRLAPIRLTVPPPVTPAEYARKVRLQVTFPALKTTRSAEERGFKLEAFHPYGPARLVRHRHPTTGEKALEWESLGRDGRWVPGFFNGVTLGQLGPYRYREVRQGMAVGEPVLLVESESSVDALRGWYATTWPGGADMCPVAKLARLFAGYDRLVLIPDNDERGRPVVDRLAAAGLTPPVIWPAEGEDARDLFASVGPAGFARLVDDALRRALVAA